MQKQVGLGLGFLVMVALLVSGCGHGAPSAVTPMSIASDAGSQAVAKLDANGDHVLDYDELAKAPGLRAAVPTIKKMGNFRGPPPSESQLKSAKISAEEIDARIQEWKALGAGRISVPCHVFRVSKAGKREPLDDADVNLVPESFLGSGLTTGTGKTDKNGNAMVAQPSRGADDPANGMSPGFYRVEITKGSEIPAKYNTDTVLGAEVAGDAFWMSSGGLTFELEY